MASEKPGPGPGLEPQPVGLIAVGAGGGGGGGSGGGGSGGSAMGELRGASGSGSVVLPAGMINPSVPIRNIRMKFAVLIGLIQVGEVSNRDIVETVLNLVREKASTPPPCSPLVLSCHLSAVPNLTPLIITSPDYE
uniref:Neurobeachin n=1 Tax=Ursus americanus TaxID=9643 RepID=A0A452RQC5_URSAM